MRYLKRQSLNRRIANDTTLYSDVSNTNVYVSPIGNGALVVPNGTNAQQPSGVNGMLRYNTDIVQNGGTGRLEVYSAGRWRGLRFAEQGPITQQSLGAGDGLATLFGPLNSTYYDPTGNNANGTSVGGQNILVVVENVLQLATTNYTIVNNPSVTGETYVGTTSVSTSSGATTLYFSSSVPTTGASSSGSVSVTGFISNGGNAIAGTILTVTSGTGLLTGMTVTGGTITAGTIISAVNTAAFTGYTSGTTLTVTALTSSALALGLVITGSNMTAGTYISAFGSGSGGTGTYTLSQNQTVASGSSGTPVSLTGTFYTVNNSQLVSSTTISGTGLTATLTYANATTQFAIGDIITVTGMTPVGYNGKYTVTASSPGSVSYACTAIGAMTVAGTITSSSAIFTAIDIIGATVSGNASVTGRTVASYVADPTTDALISITLSSATSGSVGAQASITITEATTSKTGYYLSFTSPVPVGKTVTALLGFDS
jgi:hypothetical protein